MIGWIPREVSQEGEGDAWENQVRRNNDSETDVFATEKGSKKNKTALLGDNSVEGSLDFRPTSTPNTNLPRSIPIPTMAPKTKKTIILPVVV